MTLDCTNIRLQEGSTGKEVLELQTGLKQLGYYTYWNGHYLKLDGIFGYYTRKAVEAFQRATGHDDDGVFGPLTCPDFNKKMGVDNTPTPSTPATPTKEDTPADNKVIQTETQKEIVIDAQKYNVIPPERANLTVEGIHLVAETVNEKDTFGREAQWEPNVMMNGEILFTRGNPVPPSVEITFHLHFDEYKKLANAFTLIQNKLQCKVITDLFDSGYYYITFTKTYDAIDEFKVTMKIYKSVRQLEG